MVNLEAPLSQVIKAKSVVSKFAHLGVKTLGELLWYPPRRTYRWGELTRFDSLVPGADVTVFAVVMNSQLGWTRRHDKAMLTVTLQDELDPHLAGGDSASAKAEQSPDLWGRQAKRLTVRFFAKHPHALSFHAKRLEKGTLAVFAGKLSGRPGERPSDAFLAHPEYQVLSDYDPEVVKTLSTRPQPLYHATSGLPSWKIANLIKSQLMLLDPEGLPEAIPQDLRQEWNLPSAFEALQGLHLPQSDSEYAAALEYLRYREALTLGAALAKTRNQIRSRKAWSLPVESIVLSRDLVGAGDLVSRVVSRLPFELTEGQRRVWNEISSDLAAEVPMNRLLQGEVGSGKTVLAALACVAAVQNGHQAVMLAPTEVLARQHFDTLTHLLGDLANPLGELAGKESGKDVVGLRLLTGSTSVKEKQDLVSRLEAGEALLVVGTHAILSKTVHFPRLAVAIVDEQHRFGVEQRGALQAAGERAPHLLAMSATPIPRTVAMTVFGDLDVSVLDQLPAGRGEVKTFLVNEANVRWVTRAWERAAEEIRQGGRVYVLCPKIDPDTTTADAGKGTSAPATDTSRVQAAETNDDSSWGMEMEGLAQLEELAPGRVLHTVTETAHLLSSLPIFKNTGIAVAHSNLDSKLKQAAIEDFAKGTRPLLVSTTVIEVGMDVPEASMMIILDADRFGISQLHQLRGRIGRGTRPGVCLAIAPLDFGPNEREGANPYDKTIETAGNPAVKRLTAFASTRDGFALAEADLRIRHEGDVLGSSQSGRRSRLQVLSLVTDGEVIAAAKTAAANLVARDPQLSAHPELARLVFDLGEDVSNLTKS